MPAVLTAVSGWDGRVIFRDVWMLVRPLDGQTPNAHNVVWQSARVTRLILAVQFSSSALGAYLV